MTPVIAKYKERALIILVCAGRKGSEFNCRREIVGGDDTARHVVQNEKCYVLCFVPVFGMDKP